MFRPHSQNAVLAVRSIVKQLTGCSGTVSQEFKVMKIELDKIKSACKSRGNLPGSCRGCPANPDGDAVPCDSDLKVFARCRLGFPRTWDTEKMEQEIQDLLPNKEN